MSWLPFPAAQRLQDIRYLNGLWSSGINHSPKQMLQYLSPCGHVSQSLEGLGSAPTEALFQVIMGSPYHGLIRILSNTAEETTMLLDMRTFLKHDLAAGLVRVTSTFLCVWSSARKQHPEPCPI